jgi:hypothetical protein
MKFTEIVALVVAATSLGMLGLESSPRATVPLNVLNATTSYRRLTWSRRSCRADAGSCCDSGQPN